MRPWLDRSGRLSPLKAAVFASLFLPALALADWALRGMLGPRPWTEAIHEAGLWAIRLLFLSLAVTPLRQAGRWPQLILVRRMIGVAAFAYGVLHLSLYAGDQGFRLLHVASEIVRRFYLTIGFVALAGLSALAATSTDAALRCLGGRRWRRLHRLVYGIGVLAVVHFFIQSKLAEDEPMVMAGLFLWLMLTRVATAASGRPALPAWGFAALAAVATAVTLVGEALYYRVATGVSPLLVLQASVTFVAGIRPGWYVLMITAPVALLAAIRMERRPIVPQAPAGRSA